MDFQGLSWLTPLQGCFKPRHKRGRPRKLNPVVQSLILQMRKDYTIRDIAKILRLHVDTVSEYLNRAGG